MQFAHSWSRRAFASSSVSTRAQMTEANASKPTVLVSGAGGKTGKLIAQKLKGNPDYNLRAMCRTQESKAKLVAELGLDDAECVVADVAKDNLATKMSGCDALIVATSATPKLMWSSMPAFFWKRFVMKEKVMPGFTFPQTPEVVDWQGQKAQFDAAKEAGVKHVVVVSSMGGTQPDNMLNKIGDGNILVWKRKAEMYLVDSGLPYTILHPGGLKDTPGGERQLVLGVDDELLKREQRSISRADVAELCVQSLGIAEAKNRSVDCIADAEGAGQATSAREQFVQLFTEMDRNCDYSINNNPTNMTSQTA